MPSPSAAPSPAGSLGAALARRALAAAALLLAAACGGDDSPAGPGTASLSVTVEGLPDGTAGAVTVTGAGFSRTLTGSTVLEGLAPGAYVIAGAPIQTQGARFDPTPVSTTLSLQPAATPVGVRVSYALASAILAIEIEGLPEGDSVAVRVSGPGNFRRELTRSDTLRGLRPGTYRVEALDVTRGDDGYAPEERDRQVVLTPSEDVVVQKARYAPSTGKLTVNVSGLPTGTAASILVTGPGGYSRALTATTSLKSLVPGDYLISASPVTVASMRYDPAPPSRTVTVTTSKSGTSASVTYAATSGSLAVAVNGLPAGVNAAVTVTGPNAFSEPLTASQTLTGLASGTYTVAAQNVSAAGTTYAPASASQSASVTAGATASVTVAYAAQGTPGGPSLNLAIDGMYLTQSVQTYAGTVPLVAGKNGLLRVFVRASEANTAQPAVRVRFYVNGTLQQTSTIAVPGTSVPSEIAEGTLNSSWNLAVPASLIQPGLAILADVDPAGLVAEGNEADNAFPASGTPLALGVQVVPTFNVTFVPVKLRWDPAQVGNVNATNADQFLVDARKMLPLLGVTTQLHAVYTTVDSLPLQSNDANGEWLKILSEMNALRTAEGSSRHYYGVVATTYSSGIAGYGYMPGRAAMGWDKLPSGNGVAAHEWGHNFGRRHAPCGGVSGADPNYPYANGVTGVYGYDVPAGVLKPPTYSDFMGYCGNTWISDYNYAAIMSYRAASPFEATTATLGATTAAGAERALLVWGRIDGDQVTLEPAFTVETTPVLPARRGPHRVEAVAADGRVLWSYAFDGDEPADAPRAGIRHFAFAIPLSAAQEGALAEVRVVSGARRGVRRPLAGAGASGRPITGARGEVQLTAASGTARLRWDPSRHAMAMVRDRRTGEVLAFARGGAARVDARAGTELEVLLSDGVRTVREAVRVP